MPASQAGRRGFEPRLPLHLFNNLGNHQQLPSLHFTQLSGKNGVFELFCRFGAPGQGGLGIYINRHADAVAALVGGDFRIDPGIMAETGMGSSAAPENCPAQARRGRAGASCADTRRYPSTWACRRSPTRIPRHRARWPTSSIHSLKRLGRLGRNGDGAGRGVASSACRCRPGRGAGRC